MGVFYPSWPFAPWSAQFYARLPRKLQLNPLLQKSIELKQKMFFFYFFLDDVDSLAFGVRKTTTRLPINKANNAANTPKPASTANAAESFEDEDEGLLDEIDPIDVEPIIDTSSKNCNQVWTLLNYNANMRIK